MSRLFRDSNADCSASKNLLPLESYLKTQRASRGGGGVIVKLYCHYRESVICNYFTRDCVIQPGHLVPPLRSNFALNLNLAIILK